MGVINLKEILKSNDEEMLEDVMVDNVISLSPESTLKEAKLMFIRYGFRSIPVVDENEKILGVVTDKDIMTLKHRFLE